MPIVHGDTVIPASSFNGEGAVANLAVGSLCMDGLLMGTNHGDADDNDVSWNNGLKTAEAGINPNLLRKVTAYTGADLLGVSVRLRSEEHTSELQSRENLVCRLLLEKKNDIYGLHGQTLG